MQSFKYSKRRYRHLILLSFAICFSRKGYAQPQPPANRMDYHLSWDGQSTLLKMDIIYDDHGKDSTVFIYGVPGAGGQPKIFDILGNVRVDGGDSLQVIAAKRRLIVRHHEHGIKTLHAEIDGALITGPRALPNEAFRPTVVPGFIYTRGFDLFMEVPDTTYQQIGLVWDHWPKDMRYLISTDPEAEPNDLQIFSSDESVRYIIMLQMSKELNITKMKLAGIPHYLLTSRHDTTTGLPDKVKDVMASYMPAIRSFWNNHDSPFYIFSAIPLLNEVPSKMTGMAMPNGLSVRYRGPLDLEKTLLIAHEVSHNWIGVNLKIQQTGMENNWFNEGFNDYIAVYNLVKAGLYSKKDFLNYVNKENFRSHYTSPVGQVPGDSIEANFFKDHHYEVIPYQRGFIYAFYLDNQIRVASGGRKGIREFLVALDRFNRANGRKPLTISEFTKVLRPFLAGRDVAADIKKNMHEGKYLDFRKMRLIKGFQIKYDKQVPVLSIANTVNLKRIYR